MQVNTFQNAWITYQLVFLVNLLTQWKAMLSQWDCYYIAYSKIYGKSYSELQSAPFKIWLVVTPAETATESEAPIFW